MSEHISQAEMVRYLRLSVSSGSATADESDFVSEIDAHMAECDACFERMHAARLMTAGILSDRGLTEACSAATSGTAVQNLSAAGRMRLRIKVAKDELAAGLRALAASLSDRMTLTFAPSPLSFAAARGDRTETDYVENDLLSSRMSMEYDGRRVSARCEPGDTEDEVLLYLYSGDDLSYAVTCGGEELSACQKNYDPILNEYTAVYRIGKGEIIIKIC